MNPQWFGDSYDIVKRFFCERLAALGYTIYVEPMLTGEWGGVEADFYRFLGVRHTEECRSSNIHSAILIDPDTGISSRPSSRHVSPEQIMQRLEKYGIVFVFDQSFSRGSGAEAQIQEKLRKIESLGAFGFYYDSHAKFLFASRSQTQLTTLMDDLRLCGIPSARLIFADDS
jgi:hypothetical protein